MRMKMGTIVGFGIGYVMGARAGRERYDQMMGWMQRRWDEYGKPLAGEASEAIEQALPAAAQKMSSADGDRTLDLQGTRSGATIREQQPIRSRE